MSLKNDYKLKIELCDVGVFVFMFSVFVLMVIMSFKLFSAVFL